MLAQHMTTVFELYVWEAVRQFILKKQITMTDMTTNWFSENNYLDCSDESERVANRVSTNVWSGTSEVCDVHKK